MAPAQQHPFLSPAWITAAQELRAEYADRVEAPDVAVRLNVTITNAPFTEHEIAGHIDTADGSIVPREGHLDAPDVAVTVPYALARRLLIEATPDEMLIAFMSGEVEVQGDVTVVLDLQDIDPTSPRQQLVDEIRDRLVEITDKD